MAKPREKEKANQANTGAGEGETNSKVLRNEPTFTTPLKRKYIWFWRRAKYGAGFNGTTQTELPALVFEIHGAAEFVPSKELKKLDAAGLLKNYPPAEVSLEQLHADLDAKVKERPAMVIPWGSRVRPVAQIELEKELLSVYEEGKELRGRNAELETVTANQASTIEALRAQLAKAGIKVED